MTTEKKLLKRARALDKAALEQIYDYYSPGLFRYAVRLLNDSDQAEDCVSETFSRFLKAIQRGGGPKNHLQAYLYRISHNWITDYYRRKSKIPISLDETDDTNLNLTVQMDRRDVFLQNQARDAIMNLTSDQRQVIVLKYFEGWTNAEIAVLLEKPVGAVKSLQHRALNALRRTLLDISELR